MAFLRSIRLFPLLMLVAGLARPTVIGAAPSKEYQVKAVFLFNFALFTDWPATAFADAKTPLVIGVAGDDPFGEFLNQVVAGEKAKGRPIEIKRYGHASEAQGCHILFVSDSEKRRIDDDLAPLGTQPILTVSDISRFARRGGMVEFFTTRGRIRLRVNLQNARAAGLTISSKLLRPAEIVGGRP